MRAYLAVRRAFEMTWDVTKGAIAALFGIAVSLLLFAAILLILAGIAGIVLGAFGVLS